MLPLSEYRASDRYTDRVDSYVRYRPSYPPAAVDTIVEACRLAAGGAVADLGAGTGIFSQLLLARGLHVHAVETNADMRAAAEHRLAGDPRFHSVAGSAEATTLADHSVDAVVAAQAFHWFDPARAIREIERILRPGGAVALIWNNRQTAGDAFHVELEQAICACCPDYTGFGVADYELSLPRMTQLFARARVREHGFAHTRAVTTDALQGLFSSLSYCPPRGTPAHAALMTALAALVARHGADGVIGLRYQAQLYCIDYASESG
jgi:SAM-dependent methyltransferase